MTTTAKYRRFLTAVSLMLAGALTIVWIALTPAEHPDGPLGAIAAAPVTATVSTLAFAYAQLLFIVALIGASQLISSRSPIMSNLAATFGIIGGFGHTIFAGGQLIVLAMAADVDNADVYNAVLNREITAVDGIPMILGLAGTVLAILFLAIGLLRANVTPIWIPLALFAFLVLEFVVGNFVPWAFYASGALYLISFVAIAVVVWKSPIDRWMTVADAQAVPIEPVATAR
jgi:hypothetical protein